ncbi:MAG TPA: hypothetical protein PKZ54_09200 [Syntrophorhabdaceae bacterium]|nr:hypothetical protein [Syntrophorhabdaceae bacterium]
MSPVEVITSGKRRRRWSAHKKKAMVEEAQAARKQHLIGSKKV